MLTFKNRFTKKAKLHDHPIRWCEPVICGCKTCKSPLWVITVDKWSENHKCVPCEGVGPYSDYWEKMQPKILECPFCGKGYCDMIELSPGNFAAKPYILPKGETKI